MIGKVNFRKIFLFGIGTIVLLTMLSNIIVVRSTSEYLYDNADLLNNSQVGLLLGTSKNLKSGSRNDFFYHRIEATAELFRNGKLKKVIISGDNSRADYNEPQDMKMELIKNGIPDSVIFLDYAGLRTLDAVVRAKEIFGQDTFIVISQKFHNERAVYLARHYGIEAFGYNAREVKAYKSLKTKIRELFARNKMFLDLLLGVKPKFSGEKVII
jgi:SanA protein